MRGLASRPAEDQLDDGEGAGGLAGSPRPLDDGEGAGGLAGSPGPLDDGEGAGGLASRPRPSPAAVQRGHGSGLRHVHRVGIADRVRNHFCLTELGRDHVWFDLGTGIYVIMKTVL